MDYIEHGEACKLDVTWVPDDPMMVAMGLRHAVAVSTPEQRDRERYVRSQAVIPESGGQLRIKRV